MYRKILIFSLVIMCSLSGFAFAPAEEEAQRTVSGVIQQIDPDGGYIVVDGEKIITSREFVEEAYFEVGDDVTIFTEETKDGPKAVDYEYNGSVGGEEELYYYDE